MASKIVTGLAALALAGSIGVTTAMAQQKELSDKSVGVLMEYAWSILPAIFRGPSGKVIEVDKKNKKQEVLVPVETARDVIKAGYMSAQAQLCDMMEEQVQNYDALMARELVKNKWTDQQLLYISTLHRMTIHMAAGKLRVVDKGDEVQVFQEPIEPSKDSCPDDKRTRVKESITAYAASAPTVPRSAAAVAPTATGSTTPVQPASATEKAKNKK